jgi:hypothetical protein
MIRIAGDYHALARFGSVESFMSEKQAELGISLYSSMARNTMLIQDGLDLCAEINLVITAARHSNKNSYQPHKTFKKVSHYFKNR